MSKFSTLMGAEGLVSFNLQEWGTRKMNRLLKVAGLAIVALAALGAGPAWAVVVDCDFPESIQAQLIAGETVIDFTGTCIENIEILNDGTKITGTDPTTNVIDGDVQIDGVQRVSLENFTIEGNLHIPDGAAALVRSVEMHSSVTIERMATATMEGVEISDSDGGLVIGANANLEMLKNPGDNARSSINNISGGIFIVDGARVLIRDTDIGATAFGIQIARGANARFRDVTIAPATVDDADSSCNPICIFSNSSARFDDTSIITDTEDPGIGGALTVFRHSFALLNGTTSITNTGNQPAIAVTSHSSLRQRNFGVAAVKLEGGVFVGTMSEVDIRAADIEGDVTVDLHSVFRLGLPDFGGIPEQTELDGDATVARDSAFIIEDPQVTVQGTITCLDKESSFEGSFEGPGKVKKCTDFNL